MQSLNKRGDLRMSKLMQKRKGALLMYIKTRLDPFSEPETFEVVAWHEDATQAGNYVLTLKSSLGNLYHAIERNNLTPEQIHELETTVPKDETGL